MKKTILFASIFLILMFLAGNSSAQCPFIIYGPVVTKTTAKGGGACDLACDMAPKPTNCPSNCKFPGPKKGCAITAYTVDEGAKTITCTIKPSTVCRSFAKEADFEDNEMPIGITNTYPNPSNGELTVDYISSNDNDVEVSVRDIMGHILFFRPDQAIQGSNSYHINLSGLQTGVYFLQVQNGSVVNNIKFMIQK